MLKKFNISYLFILSAASLWGLAGIFVRSATAVGIGEMEVVFARAFFTTLILFFVILIKDKSLFKIKIKDIPWFLAAGLFSINLFNFSYFKTMRLASLSVAAVLLYTAPFFVVIIARFLFKEKLNANKIVACVLAFIGCCFVTGLFENGAGIGGEALFWGLLTGFGYALYTIFGEIFIRKGYKTLTITFYIFVFALLTSLLFVNISVAIPKIFLSVDAFIVMLLMGLFNTVIPYLLYTQGLLKAEASIAPIIATIEPVVATLVGAWLYSEKITVFSVVGILFVLSSVVLLNCRSVKIKANAKINLSLAITGKREDGYHLIDTVMQPISLFDTVTISKAKSISVKCKDESLGGEANIAFKAAKVFFDETKISSGASIYIKKRIPKAAGMGGGSADAAAVLVGLNSLYKTNLSDEKLEEMALSLGADVPFFIRNGVKRARGIGEELSDIDSKIKAYVIVAKGDKKPSTKEMYQKLDSMETVFIDVDKTVSALEEGNIEALASSMKNSFSLVWPKSATKDKLLALNSLAVSLSGSGPTYFAVYDSKREAKKDFKLLNKNEIEAYLVSFSNETLITD